MGVRAALGARPHDITKLVLRDGLRVAVPGIGVGLAGGWAATSFMASLVYGVGLTDPGTFISVTGALILMILVASLVPAGRAARLDPSQALRTD
jgi:ABC-type antimicrobial peptide transport system permease subunit